MNVWGFSSFYADFVIARNALYHSSLQCSRIHTHDGYIFVGTMVTRIFRTQAKYSMQLVGVVATYEIGKSPTKHGSYMSLNSFQNHKHRAIKCLFFIFVRIVFGLDENVWSANRIEVCWKTTWNAYLIAPYVANGNIHLWNLLKMVLALPDLQQPQSFYLVGISVCLRNRRTERHHTKPKTKAILFRWIVP